MGKALFVLAFICFQIVLVASNACTDLCDARFNTVYFFPFVYNATLDIPKKKKINMFFSFS